MNDRYIITISGIDVTKWIKTLPVNAQRKNPHGELPDIPTIQMEGDNSKNVFSPGHSNSIFDDNWKYSPVIITDTGSTIFEGVVNDLNAHTENAIFDLSSKISQITKLQLPPYYTNQKSFAEISQDMYTAYGIETDSTSYSRAIYKQEALGLQTIGQWSAESGTTILSAQQELARLGCCRHYFLGNVAYMDFIDYSETYYVSEYFYDRDVIEVQDYGLNDRQIYDGYTVYTVAGEASQSGYNTYPEIQAGSDATIEIITPVTGYALGNQILSIYGFEQKKLIVYLTQSERTDILTINSVIQIDCEGIEEKDFEIMAIEPTELGYIIEGVSMP